MTLENSQPDSENDSSTAIRFLKYFDDARILKVAFYVLVFGVIATLIYDYRTLIKEDLKTADLLPPNEETILPSFTPPTIKRDSDAEPDQRVRPEITTEQTVLNQPMLIELSSNGTLKMTGSIAVGTAEKFSEKIANISEYIKTIDLNSPGGSVYDALAISNIIRENEWTTNVQDGHLCASSCPLIFAGGKKRIAGKNAAIGVHQVFAVGETKRSESEAISGTQRTTAEISRHLEKMDIDPAIWIHALETPPQSLFYLNREELEKFRLVTK